MPQRYQDTKYCQESPQTNAQEFIYENSVRKGDRSYLQYYLCLRAFVAEVCKESRMNNAGEAVPLGTGYL